jgi:hypothetical protein
VVKRNSGLALTSERVLTMGLQISLTGAIKEVTDLLSELPIDQVDEINSKWNVLTISSSSSSASPRRRRPWPRHSPPRGPPPEPD